MRYLFIVIYMLTQSLNAQEYPRFVATSSGVDPIVIEFDSMSSISLHSKAYKWVQKSYKSPSDVIKANLEGEEIRLDGFKKRALYYTTMGKKIFLDLEYTFTIQFKDRKVRLTFHPGQMWISDYDTRAQISYATFFKKTGELKGAYNDCKPSLEDSMNELVISLCNFLNDVGLNVNDDW